MLVTLGGVRQMLVFSASRLMGIRPDDGRVLWEYPWKTDYDVNASQPIVIGTNRCSYRRDTARERRSSS